MQTKIAMKISSFSNHLYRLDFHLRLLLGILACGLKSICEDLRNIIPKFGIVDHSGDVQVIINESPIKGSDDNGRVSQILSVAVLIVDPTCFHSCPNTCLFTVASVPWQVYSYIPVSVFLNGLCYVSVLSGSLRLQISVRIGIPIPYGCLATHLDFLCSRRFLEIGSKWPRLQQMAECGCSKVVSETDTWVV